MKKGLSFLLVLLLLGVFVYSGWNLLQISIEYRRGEQEYARLAGYIVVPETTAAPEAPIQEAQASQEEWWPQVDFAALQQLNPDVVGWIYLEGTDINYPIVQGFDNEVYLYHLVSGEYNSAGSIFLDAGASSAFLSRNHPVYGHHMKNGTMFADLVEYRSQEFYDAHPVAYLLTPEKNYKVYLFSAYTADALDDAWQIRFSDAEYACWLEEIQKKSCFSGDVTATTDDRIVTFSTCTYETDDARFVVHGILAE